MSFGSVEMRSAEAAEVSRSQSPDTDDSQHVSVDLFPSHYDVGPLSTSISASPSTPPKVTGR
jgi:hypothetical protein